MGFQAQKKVTEALINQQGGFPNLPFMPGVIDAPQETPPYYGFEPPVQPRQATISTYRPDLKTKIADTLIQAATGRFPGSDALGLLGQIVYHGSPYNFRKFKQEKIGTGEGAQAFGHGIYFADRPETAAAYVQPSQRHMNEITAINKQLRELATMMDANQVPGQYRTFKSTAGQQAAELYDSLMAKRSALINKPGYTYKVDLPDEAIGKMLDWDKPLSQQPKNVKDALKSIAPWAETQGHRTGEWLAHELSEGLPGGMGGNALSEKLKAAGIPGIKYLDQGSRTTGKGTHNYVVFDETLPKILERK